MIDGSPRILLIRLSAIGDVVRTLPALHVIRVAYPNARIDWAVEQKSADIVWGHQDIDEVLLFEREKGLLSSAQAFLSLCRQVRRNRYDMVVDFHGIFKSGLLTWLSGAKERYGFAPPRSQEFSHWATNKRVSVPLNQLNRVEENLRLCERLAPVPNRATFNLSVPVSIQDEVDEFFDEAFPGGKLVVAVHVPVDRQEKQWPLEYFAAFIDMLQADGRFEALLTWGPGQFELVEKVRAMTRRKPVIAPSTPTLKHYAWIAHRAGLYFGGDTGPMHIAAAMGTPVVAVFGGTRPAQHAPYQQPCEALYAGGDTPPKDLAAAQALMRAITPEQAYDACVRMLIAARPQPRSAPAHEEMPKELARRRENRVE